MLSHLRSFALILIFCGMPGLGVTVDLILPYQAKACAMCGTEVQARALEKLLAQYKALADNGGWPLWSPDPKIARRLKPRQADPRIATLRLILTITGDYKAPSAPATDTSLYDDAVISAIKSFQSRHGLNTDGKLNMATQNMLAVPVEKRITQIMATLTRIRENPLAAEPKSILVNLPAFTLYAQEGGHEALTMRVIVGSRMNHTPLFDNEVTDVIFNPQWHVPSRIVRNEMIPKLRKNPSYFIKANFVVTQDGVPVDPMQANPDGGELAFRQLAGTGNALGKIKFNIPDSDDIYLHSTSTPKLFAEDDRALSHGCIRLERPRDLAHFVLEGAKDWGAERIDNAYDSSSERRVKVDAVPVHLVYWTAFVDSDGIAHFYGDVYGKDNAVLAENEPDGTITLAAK